MNAPITGDGAIHLLSFLKKAGQVVYPGGRGRREGGGGEGRREGIGLGGWNRGSGDCTCKCTPSMTPSMSSMPMYGFCPLLQCLLYMYMYRCIWLYSTSIHIYRYFQVEGNKKDVVCSGHILISTIFVMKNGSIC